MNVALVFAPKNASVCLERLRDSDSKNLIILLIGQSESFRELGRNFVIPDKEHGLEVAEKFFDEIEKIENLFICGPPDFINQAQKRFFGAANKIFIVC